MEEDLFSSLKLDSTTVLETITDREQCPICKRSRKYFCYTCFQPMPSLAGNVPVVKLPYKIDIIKHRQEVDGKSTAVHAKILAPDDVRIFVYPDVPDYAGNQKVVLVCPGTNSVTLAEYMKQQLEALSSSETDIKKSLDIANSSVKSADLSVSATKEGVVPGDEPCNLEVSQRSGRASGGNVSRLGPDVVVYIDSTWNQVYGMLGNSKLADLQRIELGSYETKFWRHQMDQPSTYLSTIEAIYYTACEHYQHSRPAESGEALRAYDGRYDNLLFFFTFYYNKIAQECARNGKSLKAYRTQKRKVLWRLQR